MISRTFIFVLIMVSTWFLILAGFLVGGCAGPKLDLMEDEDELLPMPVVKRSMNEKRHEGSLWTENGRNFLFADVKARFVGDLVTVLIVENSSASKSAKTDVGRESSMSAGVENFFGLENSLIRRNPDVVPKSMLTASSKNDFKGEGSTSLSDKISSTMTAMVVDVLPSGNLVIEGKKKIRLNLETQYLSLRGVIRAEDVDADNMVLSSAIANAQISYHGKGTLSEKQRPGWGTRVFDWIWPF